MASRSGELVRLALLLVCFARVRRVTIGSGVNRCEGLNNGTIRGLSSQAADEKTLADMLSAAGNWYEGLNNSLSSRYALSSDPTAKALVDAWQRP